MPRGQTLTDKFQATVPHGRPNNVTNDCAVIAVGNLLHLDYQESRELLIRYGWSGNGRSGVPNTVIHQALKEYGFHFINPRDPNTHGRKSPFFYADAMPMGSVLLLQTTHAVCLRDQEMIGDWSSHRKKIKGFYMEAPDDVDTSKPEEIWAWKDREVKAFWDRMARVDHERHMRRRQINRMEKKGQASAIDPSTRRNWEWVRSRKQQLR